MGWDSLVSEWTRAGTGPQIPHSYWKVRRRGYQDSNSGAFLSASSALSFILVTLLKQYAADFIQPPDFLCLKQLLSYLHLNMLGSYECGTQLLLSQQKHLQPYKTEPVCEEPGAEIYTQHMRQVWGGIHYKEDQMIASAQEEYGRTWNSCNGRMKSREETSLR